MPLGFLDDLDSGSLGRLGFGCYWAPWVVESGDICKAVGKTRIHRILLDFCDLCQQQNIISSQHDSTYASSGTSGKGGVWVLMSLDEMWVSVTI
jgi:hypothetical protein